MSLIKGKQINIINQSNLNITTTSITSLNNITNKEYIQNVLSSKIADVNYAQLNQNMIALNTSGSTPALACSKYIIEYPISNVRIKVNGIEVNVGGTGTTYDCFFTPDSGVTVRTIGQEQKGDNLYWNNNNYQLDSNDQIDFTYLVNYNYIDAGSGQTYNFNEQFDNLVIRFTGSPGDTSIMNINGSAFTFGNVGGSFVFDISGSNEHTFTYLGETITIDGYQIIWDGFGSLIFSVQRNNGNIPPITVDDFSFKVLLTEEDKTFTLPILDGFNYNFDVTWDNEGTNNISSFYSPDITHTFSTSGEKTIIINGICEAFDTTNSIDATKIIELVEFNSDMNLLVLSFSACYNLTGVTFDSLPILHNIINFSSLFSYSIISTISSNLFKNNTGVTNFTKCFEGCYMLSEIPIDLFRYNTLATNFSFCFSQCNMLTTIPTDLFRYNTLATNFYYTFTDNFALTTIPTDLFRYNTLVNNFAYCFNNCYSITSIPNNFLYYNSNVVNYSYMFNTCKNITLPSIIFNTAYLSIVTNFSYFMNIYSTGDSNTGTIQDIWTYATHVSLNKANCFKFQTALSNYASIPANWK